MSNSLFPSCGDGIRQLCVCVGGEAQVYGFKDHKLPNIFILLKIQGTKKLVGFVPYMTAISRLFFSSSLLSPV